MVVGLGFITLMDIARADFIDSRGNYSCGSFENNYRQRKEMRNGSTGSGKVRGRGQKPGKKHAENQC
jgi:hypothetical protein